MKAFYAVALVSSGLLGATGVGAAAASSHADAELLGPYALIALTHAPALLALGMFARTRLHAASAVALAVGSLLFCADIGMRHFMGTGLFPYSAPLGGIVMMVGWALVAVSGLFSTRR